MPMTLIYGYILLWNIDWWWYD